MFTNKFWNNKVKESARYCGCHRCQNSASCCQRDWRERKKEKEKERKKEQKMKVFQNWKSDLPPSSYVWMLVWSQQSQTLENNKIKIREMNHLCFKYNTIIIIRGLLKEIDMASVQVSCNRYVQKTHIKFSYKKTKMLN